MKRLITDFFLFIIKLDPIVLDYSFWGNNIIYINRIFMKGSENGYILKGDITTIVKYSFIFKLNSLTKKYVVFNHTNRQFEILAIN